MADRIDDLRWALHRANWAVIEETESARDEPGSWVLEHAHLPLTLRLVFDCMDGAGRLQEVAQAHGCSVEGIRSLGVYLGGKQASRRHNLDQFIAQLSGYAYQSQLPAQPRRELAVPLGRVRTQQQLFNALVRALHFPDYFGNNWSAVDDCMRDLSWLPGPLLIQFTGLDRLQRNNQDLHTQVREQIAFWQDYWDNTTSRRVRFEA